MKKDRDNPVSQSKLEVITCSRHKVRQNVHARATIGFGFTSDWLKKWRENFEPSEVITNQSNLLITFYIQLKISPVIDQSKYENYSANDPEYKVSGSIIAFHQQIQRRLGTSLLLCWHLIQGEFMVKGEWGF